jgi:Spy/CpxP family protein refolding chaperone
MRPSMLLSAVVTVAAVVLLSDSVLAQRPGGPGRGGPGPGPNGAGVAEGVGRPGGPGFQRRLGVRMRMLGRQIDLTTEQRAKIRDIVAPLRVEAAPVGEELRATIRELRNVRRAEGPDGAKIADLRSNAQNLRQQLADIRAKVRPSIQDVLTPEQKAKLQERRANRRN